MTDREKQDSFNMGPREPIEPNESGQDGLTVNNPARKIVVRSLAMILSVALIVLAFSGVLRLLGVPTFGLLMDSTRLGDDPQINSLLPAIVSVQADNRLGTGFNVRSDGLIVTCRHLVEGASSVEVKFESGQSVKAVQWTEFDDADMALIDLDLEELAVVELETAADLQQFDPLILIGNPEGFVRIIGEGSALGIYNLEWSEIPLLLIQAPVFKGNSGSPVFNDAMRVVGMVFAASDQPSADGIIGIAVPGSEIASRIETAVATP